MPADNPTCATCRFWGHRLARLPICNLEEADSMRADVGSCRKALPSTNPSGWAVWPNVASDDWCGEHAPRVEAPKGGKPIVDSEMRLYDLASFRACATERGVTLTGNPLPGDGFVFGSTSYIYDPESPDAPR